MPTAKPTSIQDIDYGLSDEQIMEYCPSVFATEKHESRSKFYTAIPTSKLLSSLREVGFIPTFAMQSRAREEKFNFTTHLLRARKVECLGRKNPDVAEVVFRNAFDGTGSYVFFSGICRSACLNGCISGDADGSIRIYHRGNVVEKAIETSLSIVAKADQNLALVNEMKQFQLTEKEQLLLAKKAMAVRWNTEEENEDKVTFTPAGMIRYRRYADKGDSLYLIFNRLQENIIRGGIRLPASDNQWHKVRAVSSVNKNIEYNRAIWNLATSALKVKKQGRNLLDAKELVKI